MRDEHDTQQASTDEEVEAHSLRSGRGPAEAADVNAHGFKAHGRNEDAEPTEGEERGQAVPDADDDVEAHTFKSGRGPAEVEAHGFSSGRGPAEAADVKAHGLSARGRNDDSPPPDGEERLAVPDADDDVEGHGIRGNC